MELLHSQLGFTQKHQRILDFKLLTASSLRMNKVRYKGDFPKNPETRFMHFLVICELTDPLKRFTVLHLGCEFPLGVGNTECTPAPTP